MTHVLDQNLGSTVVNPLSSTGTQVLTTSATAAAGTLIVVVAGAFGAGSFSPSVASSPSLTWTVDKSVSNGSMRTLVASAYAASGLASGSTITVTYGSNMTDRMVGAVSFTGSQVSDTGRVDITGSSTTGSGSTWTSGAVSTANADDLLIGFGMVDGSNSVFTPDSPWNEVHDTNDGQGDSWESEYQIVASATSYTAGGDAVTNGSASLGSIVAYKAAAGAGGAVLDAFRARVTPFALSRYIRTGIPILGFPVPALDLTAGGPFTYTKTGAITPFGLASAADVYEASETGSVTPDTSLSGADVAEHAETGSITPFGLTSGADSFNPAETGSLTPFGFLSGADVFTASETGALTPDTSLSGADASTFTETGSLTTGALISGADVFTAAETGALIVGALVSGVSSTVAGTINVKTGSVTTGALLSGADVATYGESGSITPAALTSGADAHTATKTGSLTTYALESGTDAHTAVRLGSVTTTGFLAGVSGFESGQAVIVTGYFTGPRPRGATGATPAEAAVGSSVADTTGVNPHESDFDAPSPGGVT